MPDPLVRVWPAHRAPAARRLVIRSAVRAKAILTRDLPHQVWRTWSVARHGGHRTITLASGVQLVVRSDDFRAFRVAQLRGTQPEKIAVWRHLAELRPDLAIDVGANYGEFTMAIAPSGLKVIAVEANPLVASCLRRTTGPHANVTVVEAAAGASPGRATLYMNERSSGSASLASSSPEAERRSQRRGGSVRPVDVAVVRLADHLAETHPTMASPSGVIVKIDVEGFEEDVLAGLEPLLAQATWWRAIVEYGQDTISAAGRDPLAAWDRLRQAPGVVISKPGEQTTITAALAAARRFRPESRLPSAAPREADVLIGRGEPVLDPEQG